MLYNSNQSVVEKLPSFVKLRSPFRGLITSFQRAYKSAYQLRFVVSLRFSQSSAPGEFLGCMVVAEMPRMQPNRSSEKRE